MIPNVEQLCLWSILCYKIWPLTSSTLYLNDAYHLMGKNLSHSLCWFSYRNMNEWNLCTWFQCSLIITQPHMHPSSQTDRSSNTDQILFSPPLNLFSFTNPLNLFLNLITSEHMSHQELLVKWWCNLFKQQFKDIIERQFLSNYFCCNFVLTNHVDPASPSKCGHRWKHISIISQSISLSKPPPCPHTVPCNLCDPPLGHPPRLHWTGINNKTSGKYVNLDLPYLDILDWGWWGEVSGGSLLSKFMFCKMNHIEQTLILA